MRAVCAWSLLGAHNWNSLVTRDEGYYEMGAFDGRGGKLHPTLLAHVIKDLANGARPNHEILQTPGWWKRQEHLLYPTVFPHQTYPHLTTNALEKQRAAAPPDYSSRHLHAQGLAEATQRRLSPAAI